MIRFFLFSKRMHVGRILIVDDEQELTELYEDTLQNAGFSTLASHNGMDALLKIHNEDFDLIITDIKMPRLSGVELINGLRKKEALGKSRNPAPIIISSGFIDDNIYDKFKSVGRIHFMPKPVTSVELVGKVRVLLNQPAKRLTVDVRVVNPILKGVQEVVKSMAGIELVPGTPHIKQTGDISGDISGSVGVVSPVFRGNISLSFDEQSFLKLVSRVFRMDFKEINEENKDYIGDLLGAIFASAKKDISALGFDLQAAVPSIVTGKNHCVDHRFNSPPLVVEFSNSEIGGCRIEICTTG